MNKNGLYNIKDAKEALKQMARTYIAKNEEGNYLIPEKDRLPALLIGPPGVGKTDTAKQIAEELNIGFVESSLVHHTRQSLLGLPVITSESGISHTEYTMSEIIERVWREYNNGHPEGILFLDEFLCMSETVAPAVLSLLQFKNLGMYRMPPGWFIILAGNPSEYNRSVRKLDPVTVDRMRIYHIDYDAKTWLEYAKEIHLNPGVTEYIGIHPENLSRIDMGQDEEVVTPRSWTNLSYTMSANDSLGIRTDYRMIRQFIRSDEIAKDFYEFLNGDSNRLTLAEMEEIFLRGKESSRFNDYVTRFSQTEDIGCRNRTAAMLGNYAVNRSDEILKSDSDAKDDLVTYLTNVYDFMQAIDDTDVILGKGICMNVFTDIINTDSDLLRYIGTHNVPAYNNMVMDTFDLNDDGEIWS